LMILRAGDLFGESAFINGALRSSTAIALSDGVALALDNAAFQDLVDNDRSVSSRVVEQLVRRLRDAEDQIEIMMLRDGQSKIVSALLKLAQRAKAEDTAGALLLISPMELSTRVGMDVETVKRGVQKLREGKYLRVVDEKVEIPDVDSLRRLFQLLGVKDEIQGSEAPRPARGKEPRGGAP
jgi:CRP/FNR family transcriptional regulator, cyclic AMP receptor protein